MPRDYTTTIRDVAGFASAVSNFYQMFAGTPEEDLIYNINGKLYELTREPGPNPLNDGEELDNGFIDVTLNDIDDDREGYSPINDSDFKNHGWDLAINGYIDRLDEALSSGRYADGSIEQTMLMYTRHNLDKLRDRALCFDVAKNKAGAYMVNGSLMSKVANNGFIPVLPEEITSKFKPDNAERFFTPNNDNKRAAYTREELQASADKTNYHDMYKEGINYMNSFHEFTDTIGIARPDSEQKQQILRDKLLGEVSALRNEAYKTIAVNSNDPVVVASADGIDSQAGDMYDRVNKGRSYYPHIKTCDRLERYLRSGMPVEGYGDYLLMLGNLDTLKRYADSAGKYCANAEGLYDAVYDLDDKLNALPGPGATAEEIETYNREVNRLAKRVEEEDRKLTQNVKYRDVPEELGDKEKKAFKSNQDTFKNSFVNPNQVDTHGAVKNCVRSSEDMLALGNAEYNMFHTAYTNMMEDMEDERTNIKNELIRYKNAHSKNYDAELNKVIDDTIKLCDDRFASPDKLNKAIGKLSDMTGTKQGLLMDGSDADRRKAAMHYGPLSDWAANTKAHHDNLIRAAAKKGIVSDVALSSQLDAERHPRQPQLREALDLFNTSKLMGKETTEHRLTRESAERLINLKNELDGIDKTVNPAEWRAKANQVLKEAEIASDLAGEYRLAKKNSATLPGGKRRLEGADNIRKEAELLKANLKKELTIDDRYEKIRQETRQVEPLSEAELKAMDDKVDKESIDLDTGKDIMKTVREMPLGDKMNMMISAYATMSTGDATHSTVAKNMLKDVAFESESGKIRLEADKMKGFFKDLGKFAVEARLDYVKELKDNPGIYPITDKSMRAQMPEDIVDKFGTMLEDPRIRRYNSSLSKKDIIEGKKITADKLKQWYEEGLDERKRMMTSEERALDMERGDLLDDAFAKHGITEDNLNEHIDKVKEGYLKNNVGKFKTTYDEIHTKQENKHNSRKERNALKDAQDKAEREKMRADAKAAVEKQKENKADAKANEPKVMNVNELREKAGFDVPQDNNAPRRNSIASSKVSHDREMMRNSL